MEEEFEELEEELLPLLEIELLPLPVLSTITTDPPLEAVAVPALVSGLVPDVLVSRFTNAKNGNNIPFFLPLQPTIERLEAINNIRIFFIIPISLFIVRIKDEEYYIFNTIREWNYR
ncbi:hypothetical protein LEP1GSC168_0334 [Leptospira santarosai str. HAI134]|nr:hypothetical protein LEP1GSC040_0550 [Leptospira santarosai str. 2000030832]EMO21080.1 hypothetical protein LEP1GSC168_0334 [Leptospira santarosai str. HAI134]